MKYQHDDFTLPAEDLARIDPVANAEAEYQYALQQYGPDDQATQFWLDVKAETERITQPTQEENNTMQTTTTTGREHIEAGDELELYAINTAEIYPTLEAIHHVAQRQYDRLTRNGAENVADNVFQHVRPMVRKWLDTAAHHYGREFPDSPYPKFTDAAKDYAANSVALFVLEEAQVGNFR